MTRIGPPPLATWILEHLTPGDRDPALAGDLLEQYNSGRSDRWYWRQAIAACAEGWAQSIRMRGPLLVFVLLWSFLAPAWVVIIDRLERSSAAGPLWRMDFPFSEISHAGAWFLLNLIYLGSAILLYLMAHSHLPRTLKRKRILRSLAISAALFLPIYFATFAVTNLVAWPGPVVARRIMSLADITSIAAWADVLRIPYFLTLLLSLWNAVPRLRLSAAGGAGFSTSSALDSPEDGFTSFDIFTLRRFFLFVLSAGVINSMLASFLLCRIPNTHTPTLGTLFSRAVFYVAVGALAGICGAWLYWNSPASPYRNHSPISFSHFALSCATGWVWIPAILLFYEQVSPIAAIVALVGGLLLAPALRRTTLPVFARVPNEASAPHHSVLFAKSLYRAPGEPYGYLIALSLYAAGWALSEHSNLIAALILGFAAFVFAWMRSAPRLDSFGFHRSNGFAALRLGAISLAAVLVTIWALLDGYSYQQRLASMQAPPAVAGDDSAASAKPAGDKVEPGGGGYQSIILWPVPEKKQILPPVPAESPPWQRGLAHPLAIRFTGQYWYLQPPHLVPGLHAHKAIGTPVALDIRSSNSLPLIMQAHQRLSEPIPFARCRELSVDLEDADDHLGSISVAIFLGNTASSERAVYLGQQPLPRASSQGASRRTRPAHQTLHFDIPAQPGIRQFDEITVMLLPDWDQTRVAPRIAIDQFRLFPR